MTFKQFRERAGFTQKLLADFSGVSIQQIRKIEQNPKFIDSVSYCTVEKLWFNLVVNTDFPYLELSSFANEIYLNKES